MIIGIDASNIREGGGVIHLLEMLQSANPCEYDISRVIVWSNPQTLDKLPIRSWLVKNSPPALSKGQMERAIWQFKALEREAFSHGCNLLWVPGGNYTGQFRPFVTMSQNMLPFDPTEIARYGLSARRIRLYMLRHLQAKTISRADGVIFLTDFARQAVTKLIGHPKGQVATIPHGVDSSFSVSNRQFRSVRDCLYSNPFRLVYVSHASPYKHQWHVIKAVHSVREATGWQLRLDLLGPKSVQASVRRIDATMDEVDPNGSWVTFHGSQSRDSVKDFLIHADMGIFASSCENMPIILLEKMAAGLPMACSNRGPMPEVLENTGSYFDPENPTDIANSLLALLSDLDLRKNYSFAAMKRASEFTWERCARDTLRFLTKIGSDARKG